jgi:hypothetical protein
VWWVEASVKKNSKGIDTREDLGDDREAARVNVVQGFFVMY